MNDNESPETYWMQKEPLEFAQEFFERVSTSGNPQLLQRQRDSHLHYYGAFQSGFGGVSSSEVSRSGDQGENVEIYVNHYQSYVSRKQQIVVAPELAWSAVPTTTDAKAEANASNGSRILETLWQSNHYASKAREAVLGALIYGEEFLFAHWNPAAGNQTSYDQDTGHSTFEGDLELLNVASWNVARDTSAQSFDRSSWLAVRLVKNRWDLVACYPDSRDEILAAASATTATASNVAMSAIQSSDPDNIACWYFYAKRSAAMPKGLEAVLINDTTVLYIDDLQPCHFRLPVHRMAAAKLSQTVWPYSECWEALGIQDLHSDISSSIATNAVALGKQMVAVFGEFDIPVDQVGNGPFILKVKQGMSPPVGINLLAQPPQLFDHVGKLEADMRSVMGLDDISAGITPTAAPNAQAWALQLSITQQANGNLQHSYVELVENVGKSMLSIFKAKASVKRKVAMTGLHGVVLPQQAEYDSDTFADLEDIVVQAQSPMSQTAAGRMQLADKYIEMGFVKTPEQLEVVVSTGKLEPLTQTLTNELNWIQSESEQLLKGEQLGAMYTDSHQMHIREHINCTFNAAARKDPNVLAAIQAHIKQHMDFAKQIDPTDLAIMGQAAPPPPAGAGGMLPPGAAPAALGNPLGEQGQPATKLPSPPPNPQTGEPMVPDPQVN